VRRERNAMTKGNLLEATPLVAETAEEEYRALNRCATNSLGFTDSQKDVEKYLFASLFSLTF
jgi:hypothetical protein